jgi:pilus assembly protein CpaB
MAERRFTLVFSVAIATAAAATFGVYRALQTTKEESRVPMRAVVVAAADVREGSSLDKTMLEVREWPVATVPDGAFGTPDSLVGRVARVAVFKGEPLVPGRLAPLGSGAGLEVKITPGKRAMAIRINDVAGIAGMIQPNSRVDVLVTLRDDAQQQGRQVAKLFMENMRVLSVGTQVERGEDGKPINATTTTLEVTPQEAERLAVASNTGTIQLVLRGFGDPDSVQTKGAGSGDVVASMRPTPMPRAAEPAPRREPRRAAAPAPAPVAVRPTPAPAPRAPDTTTVLVYRGEKQSQHKFVKPDSQPTP